MLRHSILNFCKNGHISTKTTLLENAVITDLEQLTKNLHLKKAQADFDTQKTDLGKMYAILMSEHKEKIDNEKNLYASELKDIQNNHLFMVKTRKLDHDREMFKLQTDFSYQIDEELYKQVTACLDKKNQEPIDRQEKKSLEEQKKNLADLEKKYQELQDKLTTQEKTLLLKETEMTKLKEENAATKEQVNAEKQLQEKIDSLSKKTIQLEIELRQKEAEIDAFKEKLKYSEQIGAQCRDEFRINRNEYTALAKIIADKIDTSRTLTCIDLSKPEDKSNNKK
jgi:hypothetical protein